MFLIGQIWQALLLAFGLGLLTGYLVWRLCSRPQLEARHARAKAAMTAQIGQLKALLREGQARTEPPRDRPAAAKPEPHNGAAAEAARRKAGKEQRPQP